MKYNSANICKAFGFHPSNAIHTIGFLEGVVSIMLANPEITKAVRTRCLTESEISFVMEKIAPPTAEEISEEGIYLAEIKE